MDVLALSKQVVLTACAAAFLVSCAQKEETLPGERLELRAKQNTSTDAEATDAINDLIARQEISLPAASLNASWTHRNGTAAHSIAHPSFSTEPRLRWTRDIGSGNKRRLRLSSDPVIMDGRVFALDSSGQITALSTSGSPLWSRSLVPASDAKDAVPGGGLAVADGLLVATTGFGDVVAMDPATGAEKWRQKMPASISAAPVISGDRVIALSRNNLAYGLTRDFGRIAWEVQGVDRGTSVLGGGTPALAGGLAILPFASGEVISVIPRNGITAWSQKISGRRIGAATSFVTGVSGDPVSSGDNVYFGTQAGRLTSVDRRSGQRNWTAKEGAQGPVWPAGGSIFLITDQDRLKRLDASTGEPLWTADLPRFKNTKKLKGEYAHYGPVLAGGVLWVAGGDGALRKFNPIDGKLIGSVSIPSGAASQPAVAGGVMYVLSNSGQLHAFQ